MQKHDNLKILTTLDTAVTRIEPVGSSLNRSISFGSLFFYFCNLGQACFTDPEFCPLVQLDSAHSPPHIVSDVTYM